MMFANWCIEVFSPAYAVKNFRNRQINIKLWRVSDCQLVPLSFSDVPFAIYCLRIYF